MDKLTKGKFLAGMKAGWEIYGYASGFFFADSEGKSHPDKRTAKTACAIGAAAVGMGVDHHWLAMRLDDVRIGLWDEIAGASNRAGNKEDAIRAVSKVPWRL